MQVYTSLQTNNHASTPPLSFFTGRVPFLPPNQQRQSTEGNSNEGTNYTPNYTIIHQMMQNFKDLSTTFYDFLHRQTDAPIKSQRRKQIVGGKHYETSSNISPGSVGSYTRFFT